MPDLLPLGRRRATVLCVVAVLTGFLGACGSSTSKTSSAPASAVSPPRCAANRAAGTISYLTGFGYQASVGILDVVAAQAQGLYRAECLAVRIQPGNGDAGAAAQLAASGRATVAELGSPSDGITAQAAGVDVDAIATYGNVPAVTLLTEEKITNLRQLEGQTLGYKGAMPPQITAMLRQAGVDTSKIREVGVGYDPTVLPRGQVAALTGYKTNEPVQLADQGFKVRQWNPDSYGIRGSFNVLDVNRSFARAHRSAVEDFLRATFKAFAGCVADTSPCIAAAARDQNGYDTHQNTQEWKLQAKEVTSSLLPGKGVGAESVSQWIPEAQLLVRSGLVKAPPDLPRMVDPQYVMAIESNAKVVWPAP